MTAGRRWGSLFALGLLGLIAAVVWPTMPSRLAAEDGDVKKPSADKKEKADKKSKKDPPEVIIEFGPEDDGEGRGKTAPKKRRLPKKAKRPPKAPKSHPPRSLPTRPRRKRPPRANPSRRNPSPTSCPSLSARLTMSARSASTRASSRWPIDGRMSTSKESGRLRRRRASPGGSARAAAKTTTPTNWSNMNPSVCNRPGSRICFGRAAPD